MKDESETDTNKQKHALTNPYENNNIFFNVHKIKFTFYIDFFVKYLFGRVRPNFMQNFTEELPVTTNSANI